MTSPKTQRTLVAVSAWLLMAGLLATVLGSQNLFAYVRLIRAGAITTGAVMERDPNNHNSVVAQFSAGGELHSVRKELRVASPRSTSASGTDATTTPPLALASVFDACCLHADQ